MGAFPPVNWEMSDREPAGPHYYTREFPMQQWLNALHIAGDLLAFVTALTNFATALTGRTGSHVRGADNTGN